MKLDHVLGSNFLFDEFSAIELDQLAAVMTEREVFDGEVLVLADEKPDRLYIVIEGEVEVSRMDGGQDTTVAVLGAGAMFGLVALLDGGRRSATCAARGPGRVAEMPRQAFQDLQQSNAPLAGKFQFAIARQLTRDVRQTTRVLLAEALG